MSFGNDPSRFTTDEDVEAGERLAAARQERAELAQGGPAPTVEAILREMGRGPDGYPIEDGPDGWVPASEAGRRALAKLAEQREP